MADLVPAETIAVEYNAVKQAFTASTQPARFMDLSGRLTLDERKQITARVEALSQKTGARVWVLALPGKTDVNQFAKIHDEAKMTGSDVLFIFSQGQRHLHNKALGKDIGNEILKVTNGAFYKQSQTKGVVDTLDEFERRLGTSAPGVAQPGTVAVPAPKKSGLAAAQPFIIVGLVAVIVWIALRKKPEPPKRPSLPKARARTSRPDKTPVPEKVTTGSRKRTSTEEENMSTVDETRRAAAAPPDAPDSP